MGAQTVQNKSDPGPALTVAQESGSLPALAVVNSTSTGGGIQVQGAGTLIDLQTAAGVSKFKVSNSGAATITGGVTGTKAFLYQYLEPTGTLAASIGGRWSASVASAALTSGTVYAFALPIESGLTISNLTLVSLTAEATGTHAWVGIADSTGKVLAISVDKTGAAYFAGNTAVTTAITIDGTNPLVTATSGLYYAFVCVVASGTMPTFASAAAFANAAISTVPPIICGTTLTSQTTPVAVGSSLGTITPTAGHQIYAYCT